MQKDVGLMLGFEPFGVSGLAVGNVGVTGLDVVNNLRPQHSDLRHAGFRRLDPVGYFVVSRGGGVGLCGQLGVVHEIVVLQISDGLRHLLQVELLGPIRVTSSFALSQLRLNVDQELVGPLGLLRRFGFLFLRGVLALPGEDRFQLCGGVAGAEGIHADEAFLLPASEGGIGRIALDFVSGLPE